MNRLTNRVDGLGTTLYTYDGVGQLLSEAGPWTGGSVVNTYSNRLRQTSTVNTPWTQNYYYDDARRLTNVTSPAGSFTYQYAPGAQRLPAGVALPNGSATYTATGNDAQGRQGTSQFFVFFVPFCGATAQDAQGRQGTATVTVYLSMNRQVVGQASGLPRGLLARKSPGSWSQCIRKSETRLPPPRSLVPRTAPHASALQGPRHCSPGLARSPCPG